MNEIAEGVVEFGDAPGVSPTGQVSMRQLKHAMLDAGLLDAIESAIAGMDESDRSRALIDWQSTADVVRGHPMVEMIRIAAGKTNEEVDAIFDAAALVP